MTRAFSLDTPAATPGQILTGHNFREVAPEVLSPLSWSIIGRGMELGFRQIAASMGVRDRGVGPAYVGYLAFRPFHVATAIDRVVARMPLLAPADVWRFVFGGEPPPGATAPVAPLRTRLRRLPSAAKLFPDNGALMRQVETCVAAAEGATELGLRNGSPATRGIAWERAVVAGRSAWSLHVRTSGLAILACAVLRDVLSRAHDPDTVELLLRNALHRQSDSQLSGYPLGQLRQEAHRHTSYEVADQTDELARWRPPEVEVGLLAGAVDGSASRIGEQFPTTGWAAGLAHRWVRVVELTLAERERSKAAGLRALHCLRLLLDVECFGLPAGAAAMLSGDELVGLDRRERDAVIGGRRDELAEAGGDVPVDLRQWDDRWEPLRRHRNELGPDGGTATPLAPGWASGVLVRAEDAFTVDDPVLVGERVDAMDVLSIRPVAVVTRYGSVLSHLAIVCRELRIPLLADVGTPPDLLGRQVLCDGWSGRLEITP